MSRRSASSPAVALLLALACSVAAHAATHDAATPRPRSLTVSTATSVNLFRANFVYPANTNPRTDELVANLTGDLQRLSCSSVARTDLFVVQARTVSATPPTLNTAFGALGASAAPFEACFHSLRLPLANTDSLQYIDPRSLQNVQACVQGAEQGFAEVACPDNSGSGLPPVAVAFIVIAIVGFAFVLAAVLYRRYRNRKKVAFSILHEETLMDDGSYVPPQLSDFRSGRSSSIISNIDLPPNWQQCVDDQGNIFYYNSVTGISQWEIPTS